MRPTSKTLIALGLSFMAASAAEAADEFQLISTQRIACSRALNAGKLTTATCRSYAYLFNKRTSEFYRCNVSLSMTRDAKEVVNVQADGGCAKRARIYEGDSNYSFDVAETEPPSTNAFFGAGGVAFWASENSSQKMRGCISIASGLGSDVMRCVDMKFE